MRLETLGTLRRCVACGSQSEVPTWALEEAIAVLANLYALGLMTEEMGEALQLIGKALRFGIDEPRADGECARSLLPIELGDVEAAIDFAERDGIIAHTSVAERKSRKLDKLLNPASCDDQGKRLAPVPRAVS